MSSSNPLDALASQNPFDALKDQPSPSGNPLDQIFKENAPAPTAPDWRSLPVVSSGNPLDQLLIKPQPAATPAPADWRSLPVAGASSSNPLDAIFTKPESTAPLTSGNPFDSLNPLDQLNPKLKGRILTNEEAKYGATDPEKMEDEPWYSKAWEWMNSPLYDLHKFGTRSGAGTFERGLETGLEDIGSGFTSPLQIALTIATFGGGAVEGAGLSVLRSIGVSAEAAPVVARSAKALMGLGFSAQMLGGLVTQSPQFLDALKDGDVETATRLGTNMAASGLFLRESLKHGIEDSATVKRLYNESRGIKTPSTTEKLAEVSKLGGVYDAKKSMGNDAARARMEEIRSQLKEAGATDAETQAGIRHFMTQDGDVSRIQKMIGIAESTIRPREYTPEEKADIEKIADLHSWVNKSSPILKNEDGAPTTFYLNDSSEGTHKLGQTLSLTGDPEDAHYVQVKDPFTVRSEESLQKYVDQSGGQEAAKAKLQAAGHDSIVYSTQDGPKVITFNADQYRPVEKYHGSNDPTWNREHVFVAVDKKNSDIIRNAGIGKNPQKANVQYFATPEQALKNSTLPDSGKKSDLVVFSVPRSEVEAGVRETNAAIHGKLQRGSIGPVEVAGKAPVEGEVAYRVRDAGEEGVPSQSHSQATMSLDEAKKYMESRGKVQGKPQEIVAIPLSGLEYDRKPGPNGNDWLKFKKDVPETNVKQLSDVKPSGHAPIADDMLITAKRHMPGHEIELDEKGQPTGRAIPLRPLGAEDMPGDNSRFLAKYTPAEKEKYIAGLNKALSLSPEQQAVAKTLRQLYDNSFKKANDAGLIRSWVEAYHPQAWADDSSGMWNWLFDKNPEKVTNKALNQLRHDTNSGGFDTNINAAKHRAYNTEFQGVMAGEKFKTDDLALHAFNHIKAIDQAIAAREYISSLREKSVRASDGRPAAVLAGTSRVMGAGTDNPALAINPNSVKPIRISDDEIERMQQHTNGASNELQEKLQNGTIEKLPWTVENEDGQKVPAYAYSSEGYVAIDHPAMRGWGFSGVDTAGNPAILRGEIMVHPDFATHIRQVVGADKSIIQESAIGRGVLKASSEAKGMLLSFSPFHIIQEALRAAMVGIKPWEYSHIDINENPELQRGVRNGLVRGETHAKDEFSSGYASHSTLISKVPGLNRFQSWMQNFLFSEYIPGLKDRAYIKLVQDIRDQNKSLTADEASSRASSMVNDVFGGQNYRRLGISASQQDFFRMTALAPDWLLSEARMLGRAAGLMDKETGAIAQKQMAKQMAAIWLGARVLNMVTSGQMHLEAPFGVAGKNDKGEETIYSVRTLPNDLIHILADPREFIAGRVNPLVVRPAIEGITGRDQYGRRATGATQVEDVLKNVVPIAAQGSGLFKSNPLSGFDQFVKASGASVYKYRTEARKLAQQYASDRTPTGPISPEHMEKHQTDIYMEDRFRKGQVSFGDVVNKIGRRRADEIRRRSTMTSLQSSFDRLPMSESINVWDAATNVEKDQLHTQFWKKRKAWLKEHKPAERSNEPVWRKMQNTWADLR